MCLINVLLILLANTFFVKTLVNLHTLFFQTPIRSALLSYFSNHGDALKLITFPALKSQKVFPVYFHKVL